MSLVGMAENDQFSTLSERLQPIANLPLYDDSRSAWPHGDDAEQK
jgi:hypothetical protein